MKWTGVFRLLRDAGLAWYEHRGPQVGAALAYSAVFSLAPLLLIAIGIIGTIFGEESARKGVLEQIRSSVGPTAADATEATLRSVQESGAGSTMTIVGFVMLLIGASGVFVQLQDALNQIWKSAIRPKSGVLGFLYRRVLSFITVLATGFLLLASLIVGSCLAAAAKYWSPESIPGGVHLWQAVNLGVSFTVIVVLFAVVFRLLPDTRVPWRDIWPGAILSSLLFTLGKYGIGLYLGRSSVASSYGAAGSLVVVLVWVYYSAQILLFGAEFSFAYAMAYGSGKQMIVVPPEAMKQHKS